MSPVFSWVSAVQLENKIHVAKGEINIILAQKKRPMSVCFHVWTQRLSPCQLYCSASWTETFSCVLFYHSDCKQWRSEQPASMLHLSGEINSYCSFCPLPGVALRLALKVMLMRSKCSCLHRPKTTILNLKKKKSERKKKAVINSLALFRWSTDKATDQRAENSHLTFVAGFILDKFTHSTMCLCHPFFLFPHTQRDRRMALSPGTHPVPESLHHQSS